MHPLPGIKILRIATNLRKIFLDQQKRFLCNCIREIIGTGCHIGLQCMCHDIHSCRHRNFGWCGAYQLRIQYRGIRKKFLRHKRILHCLFPVADYRKAAYFRTCPAGSGNCNKTVSSPAMFCRKIPDPLCRIKSRTASKGHNAVRPEFKKAADTSAYCFRIWIRIHF